MEGLRTGWPSYAPGWPSYVGWPSYAPPLWRLRADLFKKRPKSWNNGIFRDFSIRVLKLAANHEKQVFTFFVLLLPYIGVSGSLSPCKR